MDLVFQEGGCVAYSWVATVLGRGLWAAVVEGQVRAAWTLRGGGSSSDEGVHEGGFLEGGYCPQTEVRPWHQGMREDGMCGSAGDKTGLSGESPGRDIKHRLR